MITKNTIKSIAIIPARGGSKRIPEKNIKDFLGKPMIGRVIETALASGVFAEVLVSTDSQKIAEIAKSYGAIVPFFRSPETSDDFATTSDVLYEVINDLKKHKFLFDTACCIYPTAVLLNPKHLIEANLNFANSGYDTLISVMQFSYPIQRAFKSKNNVLAMAWPENKSVRSQDLEKHYHDAGQFYFFNINKFLVNKELFTDNTGFQLLQEHEAQDIDTIEDWTMAEIKYKYLLSKNAE